MDSKVFYKNNVVYRAIPKNASTYTKSRILDMYDASLASDLDDDLNDAQINAFFVIVRDPVSRFFSALCEDVKTPTVMDRFDLHNKSEEDRVRTMFEKVFHTIYEPQKKFDDCFSDWEDMGLLHMRPQNHFLYNKHRDCFRNRVTNFFRVDESIDEINTFLSDNNLPNFDRDYYNKMDNASLNFVKEIVSDYNIKLDPFLQGIYKEDYELFESV